MKKLISREGAWKCDTPALMAEILNNNELAILTMPLTIFRGILGAVAARAIKLNDPILNELMCDLRLYELPSPSSKEYDTIMKKVRKLAQEQKEKENTL